MIFGISVFRLVPRSVLVSGVQGRQQLGPTALSSFYLWRNWVEIESFVAHALTLIECSEIIWFLGNATGLLLVACWWCEEHLRIYNSLPVMEINIKCKAWCRTTGACVLKWKLLWLNYLLFAWDALLNLLCQPMCTFTHFTLNTTLDKNQDFTLTKSINYMIIMVNGHYFYRFIFQLSRICTR